MAPGQLRPVRRLSLDINLDNSGRSTQRLNSCMQHRIFNRSNNIIILNNVGAVGKCGDEQACERRQVSSEEHLHATRLTGDERGHTGKIKTLLSVIQPSVC